MKNYWLISLISFCFACSDTNVSKIPFYNEPDFTPHFCLKQTRPNKSHTALSPLLFISKTVPYSKAKRSKEKYMWPILFLRAAAIFAPT